MKMRKIHYKHIKDTIERVFTQSMIESYTAAYTKDGHSNKRLRWDVYCSAGLVTFSCDVLYKYLDDTHIDTALRQIFNHSN